MKLLFLMDGAFNPVGATHNLARLLCGALSAQGHAVTILEARYDTHETLPASAYPDGVRLLTVADSRERELHALVNQKKATGKSRLGILLGLVHRPRLLLTAIDLLLLNCGPLSRALTRETRRICRAEHFDWVIAVSAPHYTTFALARARIPCHKAAYWLDPYASSPYYQGHRYLRQESRLYQRLDRFFVTELMARQNAAEPFVKWTKGKCIALPFPNLVRIDQSDSTHKPAIDNNKITNKNKINCVYVGSFYRSIRSPEALLQLFALMPDEITFTLVGGWEFASDEGDFPALAEPLGDRLILAGRLPLGEAHQAMCDADVLINLGNQNPNQLPSKLYDYLSTGRPILNICAIADCPTLPVLARWPLALSLQTSDIDAQSAQAAATFCKASVGKRLSWEQVSALYPENTPDAVAARFAEELDAAAR